MGFLRWVCGALGFNSCSYITSPLVESDKAHCVITLSKRWPRYCAPSIRARHNTSRTAVLWGWTKCLFGGTNRTL